MTFPWEVSKDDHGFYAFGNGAFVRIDYVTACILDPRHTREEKRKWVHMYASTYATVDGVPEENQLWRRYYSEMDTDRDESVNMVRYFDRIKGDCFRELAEQGVQIVSRKFAIQ